MNKKSIVIVGGGISGLVAARELALFYQVTLLEALPWFGGRAHTIKDNNFPVCIEAGAEFVHGEAEHTISLLKEAGISHTKVEGQFYRKENDALELQTGGFQEWDLLLSKMGAIQGDMNLYDFLAEYFGDGQFEALRTEAITFAEGFDLADAQKVSVKSLYEEWSHESSDYRIQGGYRELIRFLVADCKAKGCKLFSTTVKEIQWSDHCVRLITANRTCYEAEKCLITVSLGVLQRNEGPMALKFTPELKNYRNAVQEIGFGAVIKIVLAFRDKFWEGDTGFIFSKEVIPTWWTQLPDQVPVLTGWAGGPKAQGLSSYSDDQLLEEALLSLSAIFNLPLTRLEEILVGARVFNWHKEPAVSGAYSYAFPGTAAARQVLNMPVSDTLYFAGEGLYTGIHPGTVEAAIISAKEAAEKMKPGLCIKDGL